MAKIGTLLVTLFFASRCRMALCWKLSRGSKPHLFGGVEDFPRGSLRGRV